MTRSLSDRRLVRLSRLPKIYYTTRTHKQIANVIREFKKTAYSKDTR